MSVSQAEQFEANEQYEEAYNEYLNAYQSNPKDLNVLERLGHNALLLDKKEEAAKYYNEILEMDATNTMAYEMLMDIYISTDKYKYYVSRGNLHSVNHQFEHALGDYKKALPYAQNEEETAKIHFVLATLYEQIDNNMKAIDEYLKVLDFENTTEVAYLKLANLYIKENASGSASEILERALKDGYTTSNIKEALAGFYVKQGNFERAMEVSEDELTKTKCLLGLNKSKEAKDKLDELQKDCSENPIYLSLMAEYYFNDENWDSALEYVDKYNEVQSNSPLTYQMRALIYENKGDDYNAHLNWGKYNIIRGDKDVAVNEYLNAYQIKNDDIGLVSSLANLLEATGDRNHAMEFYERLSQLDSSDRKALEKLAEFRESIGDYKGQADYLEKLYETSPRNFQLVLKLAKLYEKLKNKPAAIEYYQKYLSIAPISDEYTFVENKLKEIENVAMEEDEGLIGFFAKLFKK